MEVRVFLAAPHFPTLTVCPRRCVRRVSLRARCVLRDGRVPRPPQDEEGLGIFGGNRGASFETGAFRALLRMRRV